MVFFIEREGEFPSLLIARKGGDSDGLVASGRMAGMMCWIVYENERI